MSLLQPQKKEENLEKTSGTVADPITEAETDNRKEERGPNDSKTEIKPKSETEKHGKQDGGTSDAAKREETVDKELLQAFRFFDRNQAGYVRVRRRLICLVHKAIS
jgi:hypothetical protein